MLYIYYIYYNILYIVKNIILNNYFLTYNNWNFRYLIFVITFNSIYICILLVAYVTVCDRLFLIVAE